MAKKKLPQIKRVAHPKKKNPPKKRVSPSVRGKSIRELEAYFHWFENLPAGAGKQINTAAANLIKKIRRG